MEQKQNMEIIPSGELTGIEVTLGTIGNYEVEMDSIHNELRALVVKDQESKMKAGELKSRAAGIAKSAEAVMTPYVDIVTRVKEFVQRHRQRVSNRYEEIRSLTSQKVGDYDRKRDLEAKLEEEKKRRETREQLEKEAAEKRIKAEAEAAEKRKKLVADVRNALKRGDITKREAEKRLRAIGAVEEADKAQAAAEEEEGKKIASEVAAKTTVAVSSGPTAGLTRRKYYYATCTEQEAYIKAMFAEYTRLGAPGPLAAMIVVSDKRLTEKAGEIQDDDKMMAAYPYVKATTKRNY